MSNRFLIKEINVKLYVDVATKYLTFMILGFVSKFLDLKI